MQQKIHPAIIGVAVVVVLAFCVFMFLRANSANSPNQLPPPPGVYNPGKYNGAGRPAPGETSGRPAPGTAGGSGGGQ